jgi:DNA-binding NarL/FixJ family response regulator
MQKILLLSNENEFETKALNVLSAEGYKVTRELKKTEDGDFDYLQNYDLLIIDQNYSLPDQTPLLSVLAFQIKTSTDYPPIIMRVGENFNGHAFYPEVDIYVTSKVKESELMQMVKDALESRQYLKVGSQYHHAANFDQLNEFFNKELTTLNRELSSYTMGMMKKNTQLHHIYSCLEKITKSNFNINVNELKTSIRQFMNEDLQIEIFFSYFNKTDPEFISKLDKIAPLSITEKKHCACLKMGLENKQVAVLFSIDIESVKKAHNRLKKKLGVDESKPLREFINEI